MAKRKPLKPRNPNPVFDDGKWKKVSKGHLRRHCHGDRVDYWPSTGSVTVNGCSEGKPADVGALIDHLTHGCHDPECCSANPYCDCAWCSNVRKRQRAAGVIAYLGQEAGAHRVHAGRAAFVPRQTAGRDGVEANGMAQQAGGERAS